MVDTEIGVSVRVDIGHKFSPEEQRVSTLTKQHMIIESTVDPVASGNGESK